MSVATPGGAPPRRVLPLALSLAAEGDLSAYFEGLANPTRLRIVQRLAEVKESRVSDVALLLGISQPRMSWHLRLLRRARIVTTRREGREVYCRLDLDAIRANLSRFQGLLDGAEATAGAEAERGGGADEHANQERHGRLAERSIPEVVG